MTCPLSGRCRPMIWRMRTDLPLPLPPRTARVSPRRMSNVIPCKSFLGPNALCTSSKRTTPSSIVGESEGEEELGEKEVGDPHRQGRRDERLGGGATDAVGTSLG